LTPTEDQLTFLQVFTHPPTYALWCGIVLLFGLLFGSFFNVCIYRVAVGMSVNRPRRSLCFRCGSPVRWHDNIPILGWLLLRGRCRDCGARFGIRYAFVELLTGVVFLAIFFSVNPPGTQEFQLATLWYFAFAGLLIVGTFTDFDHWIIPDGVSLGGGVAAVVAALLIGIVDSRPLLAEFGPFPIVRLYGDSDGFSLFIHLMRGPTGVGVAPGQVLWWEPLANALLGVAFGMGLLYSIGVAARVFLGKEGMGMGDVKLFALIGGTLGIMGSILTLVLASFLGVIAGGVMLVRAFLVRDKGYLVAEMAEELRAAEPVVEVNEGEEAVPLEPGLVERLESLKATLPGGRRVHHLPFGPWLSLGALLVLLFQEFLQGWLGRGMF
jgi:leader peptidase (prepilin peptidase) / N-methyltransferase